MIALVTMLISLILMFSIVFFLPKSSTNKCVAEATSVDKANNEEIEPNFDLGNKYQPIKYDQDDSYDNFYMQREDEYKEEYGDDFEDAVQDGWEERHGDK